MKIGVLGRVAAWDDDGSEIALRPQFRRLLGLLVATGTTVTLGQIAEYVAGGRATGSAARTAAGRLRSVVGDRLVTAGSSYELQLGQDELDVTAFAHLRERSAGATAKERITLLRAALAEWRGPAFGDLADEAWA
ncbi:AfsR/SARP family transcriptional regulator, partial [Ilumatobacter sp.]|uniref:AfsR/SARP family transcriptional regulator n=1 Tax=Ilumatobacter sp. TaxID=1967498 RepID=UPI003C382CAB